MKAALPRPGASISGNLASGMGIILRGNWWIPTRYVVMLCLQVVGEELW